jgi:hypothetical protein
MTVIQCDHCKRTHQYGTTVLAAVNFTASQFETQAMFCGWRCLADYARARVLIGEAAEGGV